MKIIKKIIPIHHRFYPKKMKTIINLRKTNYSSYAGYNLIRLVILALFLVFPILIKAQTLTTPQVPFLQRTSTASPAKTIYNIKGDFTLLGNTNLTLLNYGATTDNQSNTMKYVDIDGDPTTLNSSTASLELSNSAENSASQNCSTVLFAGLYWTGKSDDANETFSVSNITASHNTTIPNTNYVMTISRGGSSSNNYYPIYTFTGNGHTYAFNFTNATSGASIVTLKIDGVTSSDIPVSYNNGVATFITPYTSDVTWGSTFTISSLTRNTSKNYSEALYQSSSYANMALSTSKTYNKKVISLKGPNATNYETITGNSEIRFPGTLQSGIFIGYSEITDYVKAHGAGAYTVADIALTEGSNPNPGLSGGWAMVVIYENPLMKSRAVTLFDGYAYVNGQLSGGGEYGTIPISGFTTAGSGQVNMKLGVMAAEGDVNLSGDYLAVQKLNADPAVYNSTNYLTLNHAGNSTSNFFNSSIFPFPGAGNSNPNLVNNTGVDFSMFTIPNTDNLVIGNNQTATTFRFGSTSDVFTIFGFAMSVDAYIPEPKAMISVNSINNITNPAVLSVLPGQTINYSLNITNEGTEATNNTVITIPIPTAAIFQTGTITYNTYNGFTTATTPYYDAATNKIIWNLGTLPITANHPEYIYADISFTLDITTNCSTLLNAGCSPEVSLETGTITGTGTTSGSSFTKYFFQGYDETSCHLPIDGSIKVSIDTTSCLSDMAGTNQVTSCGGEKATLNAAAGTTGTWSIISGPVGGGEVFSNTASPTSTFSSPNSGVYTLRWTTSCATTDDVTVTFESCNYINFEGIDDHINFNNKFNLNSGSFSIEAWIKSNATNGNTQTILSKRLSTNSIDGYDLRLVNNYISFNWNNGTSITSTYPINSNRWYHIAVTFSGSNYNLYIDGVLVKGSVSGSNPGLNTVNCIVGAMDQNNSNPVNYFNGWIDELRIWNTELTVNQIRQMMNQEIKNNGGNVNGAVIPKDISGLTWDKLAGYYQMNGATDLNNGYLLDMTIAATKGKLVNIYAAQPETAPLPYTSRVDGNWETKTTWTNHDVWDAPQSLGINSATKIDWNIVKTSNNITSNSNKTVLGLLVTNNTLSAIGDSKIEVSSYLKLDGKIDLVGKSQLVQTSESDLDVASAGSIERDQQGQSNLYNYNYWCSPTSPINTIANNANYTIGTMLKDGTTSTPQNINWIGGYNGAPTSPISIARYWLFKFDNYANAYANWSQLRETSALRVGQGFTMKGSGAASGTQNLTFVGKPNNGLITTNSVAANQLLLTGNPYPSALDANAFILDNVNSIDGTLYFWEHYATNNTHILRETQGGYAELNLTGGVPPTSSGVDFISQLGAPSKGAPNQFIPVGQGFFVTGKPGAGGTVVFNNGQRGFHKEDEANVSNVMFKTTEANNSKKPKTTSLISNSNNDPIKANKLMKIRLGYNTNANYHRQVLLGFMNENATIDLDYGYDGFNKDNLANDMFFLCGGKKLAIQGVGFFKKEAAFPIGVKTNIAGKVTFSIDELENFDKNQRVYIYDNTTKIYHNIKDQSFEIVLPVGQFDNRFSLCFKDKNHSDNNNENDDDSKDKIQAKYSQTNSILKITNTSTESTVSTVSLFNVLGQLISKWETSNLDQNNIEIPILNISSGIYITKIATTNGDFSKKIIIP
jgi:hypothetical protein